MKKGYWVVAYRSISDESAVKAYGALAVPAVQSFGGRFLTRSTSRLEAHEAGSQQRTVVVEFDSCDIALAAHESESYQKALRALGSGAERDSASLNVRSLRTRNARAAVPKRSVDARSRRTAAVSGTASHNCNLDGK